MTRGCLFASLIATAACGPHRGTGDDAVDGSSGPCAAESCGDGIDNDCDQRVDCADPDCSGIGGCPVCGAVENPEGTPLALPDGIGDGSAMCSTDAQCSPTAPNCVASECHASYVSTLTFVGFPAGARLADPSKLLAVCVELEHTWLRDLQIELITPDHLAFVLDKFITRNIGGEIYLGQPVAGDDVHDPVPGIGARYCWTPTATVQMITDVWTNGPTRAQGSHQELVPGDFKPVSPWTALTDATLNGDWTIRVTDLWPKDNGFMFSWSIEFDPSVVVDCSGPIIL